MMGNETNRSIEVDLHRRKALSAPIELASVLACASQGLDSEELHRGFASG